MCVCVCVFMFVCVSAHVRMSACVAPNLEESLLAFRHVAKGAFVNLLLLLFFLLLLLLLLLFAFVC